MTDEPTNGAEQAPPTVPMIPDIDITVGTVTDDTGKTWPTLTIKMMIEPGYGAQIGASLANMLARADAMAVEANARGDSRIVLPETAGRLFMPLPPNGHGPRG